MFLIGSENRKVYIYIYGRVVVVEVECVTQKLNKHLEKDAIVLRKHFSKGFLPVKEGLLSNFGATTQHKPEAAFTCNPKAPTVITCWRRD
ncbi:hypothetical protein GDO81_022578 [Engystomops pustulosus]|uniref:Uncharacterized protein n=1 Tax=Engystomops pustulosus TaxID=76066 RepID=A0AAV6Z474_ENGPU|nr:hypothetical protein GDO81_022578 [Engystomops pustulosus]